jgi:hypothetical protein
MKKHMITSVCILLVAMLAPGCGGDDPTAPQPAPQRAPATRDEISIRMSSITAINDCDPNNGPGDFYIRFTVHKTFEDGTTHAIGSTPEFLMQVNDGETLGAADDLMTPITFEMPREPGARFSVEWWIREGDGGGANSFSKHGFGGHQFDRNEGETWGPSGGFERYTDQGDYFVGVYKFFGYSNSGDCRVHANYAVYITPIWE